MKRRQNPPLPAIDWSLVCKRLLNPTRPDWSPVMDSVRLMVGERCDAGCMRGPVRVRVGELTSQETLSEMWERLATAEWLDDSSRGFIRLGYLPRRWAHNTVIDWRSMRSSIPTSIELMAALVSDRANVERAEWLAKEYLHRLGAWMTEGERKASRAHRISWALLDPEWGYSIEPELMSRPFYAATLAINHRRYWRASAGDSSDEVIRRFDDESSYEAAAAVSKELKSRGLSPAARRFIIPWQGSMMSATKAIAWLRVWQDVESYGMDVRASSSSRFLPDDLVGKKFRDIDNPFAPMIEIYELGYVVVSVDASETVLGVPWMGPLITGPTWRSMGMDGVSAERADRTSGAAK